ncbi:MAG: DNA methyltransferase [Lachnospiraceae bacterium]
MQIFENADCLEGMKQYPDKYFDLAIVDPPYFSGPERRKFYGRKISPIGVQRFYEPSADWKIPGEEYFRELGRVSKHQIVWGCNYFCYHFGPGRIVWDKCNGDSSFSDCEIAFCSLHDSVRLFRYMWNGMMQGKSIEEGWIQQGNKKLNEKRIHPTQKPVNLYRWLIQKYVQPGWKILDTHVGSASSLIALEEAGLDYVGYEIDPERYHAARQRLEEHRAQLTLKEWGIE